MIDAPPPVLSLNLLGHFSATPQPGGVEVTIPTRKSQALLAYLSLNLNHRFGRAHLAGLLWGDSVESLARNSLRQTLFTIRRALGPAAEATLRIEMDSLGMTGTGVEIDVLHVQRLLADPSRASLERAVAIYRGDLLAGFYLNESGFDDWLTGERERLRVRMFEAMATLLRQQIDDNDLPAATRTAERLVALDPLDEAAHRALSRLLLRQGQRGAALRAYRNCAELLDRELSVTPSAETEQVYEEIVKQGGGEVGNPSGHDQAITRAPSILVVEDDLDHASMLSQLLTREGYEVATANNGREALNLLAHQRVDIVLADIRMPEIDGLELLDTIRRHVGEIPTVLMTARTGDRWELQSLERGASDYIAKPFRTDILLLRLKNLLRRPNRTPTVNAQS
jgi:DNA-binding SARP family transcriptional activator